MDGVSTDSMLASLRSTFSRKIPGGLTQAADQRLQRSIQHFTREVKRVKGYVEEQEVLRLSYDSMASWYKRNMEQIAVPDIGSVAIPAATYELGEETENPLELLNRMKKLTNAPTAAPEFGSTSIAEIEERVPVDRPVQPKDVIQKQEDVAKYREVEYNVLMNSKDRNWLTSRSENRYNFTVQFNSNRGVPQGQSQQATILTRLRNIVRIEFIKAIFPVEGLDVMVPCTPQGSSTDGPTNTFYSILGLPYVTVTLDEFQGNNYGTSADIDKSFAVCQYDATWRSDAYQSRDNTSRGYTLFFPKFMKAQRVYAPAPLSNLQSLHFQVLTPENQPLSALSDSAMVERILFGTDVSGDVGCYDTSNNEYIFIQTKEWFPLWAFSQMDRVTFDGLTFTSTTPSIEAAGATLIDWLQRPEGHGVLSTAYTLNSAATPVTVALGANDCGYSNMIIIRTRFQDPKLSGVCQPDRFSGSEIDDILLGTELVDYPPSYQEGGILNLSRQVQIALRIITREPDIASSIRPDNV